jgi:hypothetical protein
MATDRFSDLRHSISESAAAVVDHDGHRGGTPAIWPMAGAGRLQPGASALREQPRIIAWPGPRARVSAVARHPATWRPYSSEGTDRRRP